ncbi:MAG: SpaH/EbpB family LPXTG-anchored major pilin [Oscillospiraceae bacterium]|nr:SpaH/EbpB family LPXTG-anchored major pilin [Oscillospiraceae bacterium]
MKNLKRIACLVMVIAMVLCMAMPCYAANSEDTPNNTDHTITINGAQASDLGDYQAYQVFRGDISGGKLTNITWGNGVVVDEDLIYDLSNHRLIGAEIKASLDAAAENNLTEAEAVAAVVAGMNGEELDAFAEVIGNHLSKDTYYTNDNDYSEIDVIGDGYYLLQYVGTVGEGDAYTKYIMKVVEDTSVTPKKDAPTLDKNIVEDEERVDETNGSVGDVVEYELVSNVPAMDGYDKYYYIIHDELSAGLTFNGVDEVKLGDTKLVAYEEGMDDDEYQYVVKVDGQKIKIVFSNFLQHKDEAGEKIIVTYSATINENAVITKVGNPNKAWLQYSNDPNYDHDGDSDSGDSTGELDEPGEDEPTGQTPESIVTVYTTALKIKKVADDGNTALTGAKFKIEGASSKVYKINGVVFQEDNSGTFYRLVDGTYTDTAPTETNSDKYESTTQKYVKLAVNVETSEENGLVNEGWVDDNGVLTFENLGAGTYEITELVSPAGYNLLKSPITVTITWNGSKADAMWTVTASSVGLDNEKEEIAATPAGDMFSINVVNQAGVTLPSTGGIGTTIFYVVGGLLVLAAVVLLVTKRRMNSAA